MRDHLHRLLGFDDQGAVYDAGDHVLREIRPDMSERVHQLLTTAQESNVVDLGVVAAEVETPDPLVLRHPKYRVTYPHEWPAEMLRAACLLHLDLFLELPSRGLDLKDGLPQNIVFDGAEPRFIDFLSLVPFGTVGDEPWLREIAVRDEDPRSTVLRTMFLPHFLVPLIALHVGRPATAHSMLNENACNVGTRSPRLLEIRPGISPTGWRRLARWQRAISQALKSEPATAYRMLRQSVASMDLDTESAYSSYYVGKNELFPFDDRSAWRPKQLSVAQLLQEMKPSTVLDLGCNTGWFSQLAVELGAEVVAVDLDEASLNQLFLRASRDRMPVTPLRLAYGDLDHETTVRGRRHHGEVCFTAALERLRCDMVLALGLVHHLTLGEGRSLKSVMETLAKLGERSIVVEFVDLTDSLITNNPRYFAHLGDWTPETYSLDALIDAAPAEFRLLSVSPSHPDSRRLVTFERR